MRLVSESDTRLRRASVSTNVLLERDPNSAGMSPFCVRGVQLPHVRLGSESDTRLRRGRRSPAWTRAGLTERIFRHVQNLNIYQLIKILIHLLIHIS